MNQLISRRMFLKRQPRGCGRCGRRRRAGQQCIGRGRQKRLPGDPHRYPQMRRVRGLRGGLPRCSCRRLSGAEKAVSENVPHIGVKAADWSAKREVRDRLTPYNWLFIQEAAVEKEGEEMYLTIPRRCMHCQNPPCADLCPWGAARKLKNGISSSIRTCVSAAQKCKDVCPWSIPERQTGVGLYLDLVPSLAGNGVMYKCDRCHERVAQGEVPACIEACPEGVQIIGPRDEILAEAHRLEKEEGVYLYGEHENGGTNTIYVSPVPFGELQPGGCSRRWQARFPAGRRCHGEGEQHGRRHGRGARGRSGGGGPEIHPRPERTEVAGLVSIQFSWGSGFSREYAKGNQMMSGSKTLAAPSPRWMALLYTLTIAVMALTGFGQMPIYQRYYLSDIPGLGWLADFYVTRQIHYVAAVIFLALLAFAALDYLLLHRKRLRLTQTGLLRVGLLAGIAFSGALIVVKNFPYVHLPDRCRRAQSFSPRRGDVVPGGQPGLLDPKKALDCGRISRRPAPSMQVELFSLGVPLGRNRKIAVSAAGSAETARTAKA